MFTSCGVTPSAYIPVSVKRSRLLPARKLSVVQWTTHAAPNPDDDIGLASGKDIDSLITGLRSLSAEQRLTKWMIYCRMSLFQYDMT